MDIKFGGYNITVEQVPYLPDNTGIMFTDKDAILFEVKEDKIKFWKFDQRDIPKLKQFKKN